MWSYLFNVVHNKPKLICWLHYFNVNIMKDLLIGHWWRWHSQRATGSWPFHLLSACLLFISVQVQFLIRALIHKAKFILISNSAPPPCQTVWLRVSTVGCSAYPDTYSSASHNYVAITQIPGFQFPKKARTYERLGFTPVRPEGTVAPMELVCFRVRLVPSTVWENWGQQALENHQSISWIFPCPESFPSGLLVLSQTVASSAR